MPVYAGQIVTAGQLNRIQPTTYKVAASGTVSGPVTGADVPGASITFSTSRPNAVVVAETVFDFDPSGSVTGISSGRLVIDGGAVGEYAVYQQGPGTGGDRGTQPQNYREVLANSGTHTIKLVTNLGTGVVLNLYTTLIVTVYEVV